MKSVTVKIPKGHVVDSFDKESGKVTFKPIPVDRTSNIKSLADALKILGEKDGAVKEYRALVKAFSASHHLAHYGAAVVLTKALNGGWTPNWDDSNEYKYSPWFYMDRGSSGFRFHDDGYRVSGSGVSSRLCFKSRELAHYAGKNFTAVYEGFMTIK